MIKSWISALAIGLLLTDVVTVLMAAAWTLLPLDGVAISLHGKTFSLADLHGTQAALSFLLAVDAVVIAPVAVVTMVVVGLGFGALGIAASLLATAASLALAGAPFALIGLLLWRLVRTRPAGVVAGR